MISAIQTISCLQRLQTRRNFANNHRNDPSRQCTKRIKVVAPDGPHPGRPASIHCHPSRRDCGRWTRPQSLFAPRSIGSTPQAPAPLTPARPASPRFPPRSPVCSGSAAQPERPGAPRHPPPGCPRAAAAARRAPSDQYAAIPDASRPDR